MLSYTFFGRWFEFFTGISCHFPCSIILFFHRSIFELLAIKGTFSLWMNHLTYPCPPSVYNHYWNNLFSILWFCNALSYGSWDCLILLVSVFCNFAFRYGNEGKYSDKSSINIISSFDLFSCNHCSRSLTKCRYSSCKIPLSDHWCCSLCFSFGYNEVCHFYYCYTRDGLYANSCW